MILSGGISLGLTYVGVHRAMHEAGLKPVAIGGCSVGAVMGALWSAGLTPEQIEKVTSHASWRGLVRPARSRLGLFSLRQMGLRLEKLCGVQRLEELPLPLNIWATDLATGEGIVLRQGRLRECVEASSAIPGVFVPVEIEGRMLVDGGVLCNLPLHILNDQRRLDFVLAVNPIQRLELSSKPRNPLEATLQSFLIHLRATGTGASCKCKHRLITATPDTAGVNALNLHQLAKLEERGYNEMQRVLQENKKLFRLH